MIVDSHQHFVRLARHADGRFSRGTARGQDPNSLPQMSDAEVTKNLQTVVALMATRSIDMAFASPRAKSMATHDGTVEQNGLWADLNNSLASASLPAQSRPLCACRHARPAPVVPRRACCEADGTLGQRRLCSFQSRSGWNRRTLDQQAFHRQTELSDLRSCAGARRAPRIARQRIDQSQSPYIRPCNTSLPTSPVSCNS